MNQKNSTAVTLDAASKTFFGFTTPSGTPNDLASTVIKDESNKARKDTRLTELNPALVKDSTFEINGVSFKVGEKDTVSDLVKKINANSSLNMIASFGTDGKLTLTTKNTGTSAEIKITGDAGGAFKSAFDISTTAIKGKNAEFTIGGAFRDSQTNTYSEDGMTYTFKKPTTSAITIGSNPDVDGMIANIKDFVGKYNDLIGTMYGKATETRYRDYSPLTSEQKESMNEKQIDLWEGKAQSGLLRGDSILTSAVSSLRLNIYKKVDGNQYSMLTDIGISTIKDGYKVGSGAELEIDENKLRAALEDDPDSVFKMFSNISDDKAEQGILYGVRDSLKVAMRGITSKAGAAGVNALDSFEIGKQIKDVNTNTTNFQRKLKDKEDAYWRKFTAMEVAIQKAQAQQTSFMNQMG